MPAVAVAVGCLVIVVVVAPVAAPHAATPVRLAGLLRCMVVVVLAAPMLHTRGGCMCGGSGRVELGVGVGLGVALGNLPGLLHLVTRHGLAGCCRCSGLALGKLLVLL